uniref:MSP domain-containing protein n=1 Tax=Setaria italica TaxID=4555 RepID=K3ZHC9_SETIT
MAIHIVATKSTADQAVLTFFRFICFAIHLDMYLKKLERSIIWDGGSSSEELKFLLNPYSMRLPLYSQKIKSRLSYHIHPNYGIVRPRSICSVTITLEAQKKPLPEDCVEEFCVQSTRVDESLTTKDILETGDMFEEEPDKAVDMVTLTASVCAPKQHPLVVQPPELHFPQTLELNKPMLPSSMQLANMTDDYVAFMLVMPDDKVTRYSFHIAKAMGIMPPWSTRGVVIDVQVQEEVVLPLGTRPMQCKDTALMRWVIVGKDRLSGAAHVSADLFYEQTDVHELELDIVFGAQSESQPPSPSSVHPHPTNDWEDDDQEVQLSSAEKITPFSIQTELLQIYPSELRFTSEEGAEYMSLINKTDDDVIYYIDYDNQEYKIRGTTSRGVVPPHSTCPVRVFAYKKPHGVYTHEFHILMISGSNYRNTTDLFDDSDHLNVYDNKRDEIINQVRAEGGKAHEALLMSVVRVPHPDRDSVATKQNKEIRMDENGLGRVTCMDVHPTQPWVVTCHNGSCCACIWKMVPQTSAYEKIMSTHCNSALIFSVKFIARMQWVACGDFHGYISVRTYLDDKMSEIKRFRAENDMVTALAVHPTHSYLLSCSKDNLIKLWDWEQGWMCARKFSCYGEGTRCEGVLMFNPNEANTFAFVSTNGHVNKSDIKIWSMDSDNPHTILPVKGGATSFAYCITGSDQQYMATADNHGKIEIFDLWSRTHVHTLEASWITYAKCSVTACHPSLPLLASVYRDSIVLWNYTTYGLEKAHVYDSTPYYSTSDDIKGIGFIDIEGSQRLVIAHTKKIEMVDMSYGTLTSQPWDLGPCHLPDSTAPWH